MYEITKAKPDDAEGIQNVFYNTWLATYPNEEHGVTLEDLKYRHRNMFIPENLEWRRKLIEDLNENELFLVARTGEKIVGVSYFKIEEDKNMVQAMYILPEYQGKGIGKMFWAEAKKFFDPEKDIYVEVVEYNTNAINFYKSLGFEDTGRKFTEERFRMKSGSIIPEMEMVIRRGSNL